ncbi:hypothetical protein [Rhodococcus erythropolis]
MVVIYCLYLGGFHHGCADLGFPQPYLGHDLYVLLIEIVCTFA